jgi:hypothetical protein
MMPSACEMGRPKRVRKALGGGDREAQRGQRDARAVARQQVHVIRRRVQHARALARGELEDRLRERAARQENRGAATQVEQDRDDEVVRHRQEPQHAVRRADRERAIRGLGAREDRVVADDYALAPARGAGGEAQVGGRERGEVAVAVLVDGARGRTQLEREAALRLAQQRVQASALHELVEGGAGRLLGDRHHARVGGEDAERELDEAAALLRDEPDAPAPCDAARAQLRRDRARACDERGVARALRLGAGARRDQRERSRGARRLRANRIDDRGCVPAAHRTRV